MSEGIIPPITGITWHDGKLYVAHRSRYSVLDPENGEFRTIINGLPCWGEFLNAKPIFDDAGKMIFFVSTQGNSGVIEQHWMKVINVFNKKKAHEVPGEDVMLKTETRRPALTARDATAVSFKARMPTTPTSVMTPVNSMTTDDHVQCKSGSRTALASRSERTLETSMGRTSIFIVSWQVER